MVNVPERFYQNFDSMFPSLATLNDPASDGSLLFAKAGLENLVTFTAMESARRIEAISIPAAMGEAAQVMFDGIGGYVAGITSMETPSVPEVLVRTIDGFSSMAAGAGAFSSIPIVGMIIDFAVMTAELAIAEYKFSNDAVIEANPFGYDRDIDQDWCRESLKVHGGRDITSLFCPVNDASGGIEILNTEIDDTTKVRDTVARALYIPRGPATSNLGGLPNTAVIPKGSEMNYAWNPRTRPHGVPWSHFMPALSQTNVISWQSVLTNSRACYLVDAVKVADQWRAWQFNMKLWGWGTRYSGNDRVRMSMLSRPPIDYAQQQTLIADGYSDIVPFWPGSGMKSKGDTGHAPHLGPLLGDVGAWAAEVQLGRRQRKYLGTLTVAYCSETDAAFQSDPMLADLLIERRRMLLNHADAEHVDLSQVVDADYRSALATRRGPKGIADAPGAAHPDVGDIALPGAAGALPPILVARQANAAPFLPTTRRHGGDGLKNAAVLALLSFLLR